ncbi:MAG TPA: nucleotidyltransferase family protein, partial [Candidatus Margulisiibacteriota bacterium]|nr:nucleotidyltransferase family protein [Candidatus Margulisiibacteriota bacterium]
MKELYSRSPEAQLLLDIIKNRPITSLEGINFPFFLNLSARHNLIPTVFLSLRKQKDLKIPPEAYPSLQSTYSAVFSVNVGLWKEFLSLNSSLRKNNIPFLPIKGMDILTRFFPSFDLRHMCDIDILIKEEDLPKTEALLLKEGYVKHLKGLTEAYWRNTHFQFEFAKGPVAVDLHWRLDFKRRSEGLMPLIWERTEEVVVLGNKIR